MAGYNSNGAWPTYPKHADLQSKQFYNNDKNNLQMIRFAALYFHTEYRQQKQYLVSMCSQLYYEPTDLVEIFMDLLSAK
jgi:hypothetical protein